MRDEEGAEQMAIGIETALVGLGAAVVKTATKLWFGDQSLAADASASAIDAMAESLEHRIDQRRLRRMFQQLEEVTALQLMPLFEHEIGPLPEHEQLAAIDCVRSTFDRAGLTEPTLFAFDLDAGRLDRHLRRTVPDMPAHHGLSDAATALYGRLLRQCCRTVIQVVKELPQTTMGVLTELLRRETEILETINLALSRLNRIPERRAESEFEADYRQQVANLLGTMELIGAGRGNTRKYPLAVGYVNSNLTTGAEPNPPVEQVLASSSRLLVRGEAGAGKTVLLQWIAVQCAAREVGLLPRELTELMPFFIRLRGYVKDELPAPEQFLDRVGRTIAREMPDGWVHAQLRSGKAVMLIDGVDELPRGRRKDAREWLAELIATFPNARYVVTSRPAAVKATWLDDLGFVDSELQPMTRPDIEEFIRRWHAAIAEGVPERAEREKLTQLESDLLHATRQRAELRMLATNPLLCALLCALHRERPGEVPSDRMGLYKAALEMLLGRRDEARKIMSLPGLFDKEQTLLLQDLAYWLLKNDETDAELDRVQARVAERLKSLGRVEAGPKDVLQFLLERTGLLREPVPDRVDFVHRTFQEYLAAKAAVDSDEIGFLANCALQDAWREVIVLAAGHAPGWQADKLLKALLRPRVMSFDAKNHLDPLAVACLETASDLDPKLRQEIKERARGLIPPRDELAVKTLAQLGDFALQVLSRATYTGFDEMTYAMETAARIGDEHALLFLRRFTRDNRKPIVDKLLECWGRFDEVEYAEQVLRFVRLETRFVRIVPIRIPALEHLPRLRRIELVGSFDDLEFLGRVTKLTHLRIRGRVGGSPNSLAPLADLPELIELDLTRCDPLPDLAPLAGRPAPAIHLPAPTS